MCGPILDRHRVEGGPQKLGHPLTDEQATTLESAKPYGDREVAFEKGTIYLDRKTGKTALGQWFAYTPNEPHRRR